MPKTTVESEIVKLSLPSKERGAGRKPLYDFWDIPVDPERCKLFKNAEPHKLQASLSQFRKLHGGKFTSQTLKDGSIAVWCLEAPTSRQ